MNAAATRERVLPHRLAAARVPALLRDRSFRRYWSAQTISMFGDQISSVAMPLAAVLMFKASAAQMGYLTALIWLPSLLFGLHAGAWVDRHGRRRATMIAADLGRFAILGSVPVCYGIGVLTLAQMYVVAFAAGVLSVLFGVSDSTLFVSLVPPDRYVDGNSLIYASRALSFVGGPSVGGLLVQLLTAPFAIAADALSFLGSALFLGRIRPAEPPPAQGGRGSIMAGARFIVRSPVIRASLCAIATINFFNLAFITLFTLYAVRSLHVIPGVLGVVLGAGAVGGLLGGRGHQAAARGDRGRPSVCGRQCPVHRPAAARTAGGRPQAARARDAVPRRVRVRLRRHDPRHQHRLDLRRSDPRRPPRQGHRRLPGRQLRHPAAGALAAGALGTLTGLRPTLWLAAGGATLGVLWLLPSPLPRFRIPVDTSTAPKG